MLDKITHATSVSLQQLGQPRNMRIYNPNQIGIVIIMILLTIIGVLLSIGSIEQAALVFALMLPITIIGTMFFMMFQIDRIKAKVNSEL